MERARRSPTDNMVAVCTYGSPEPVMVYRYGPAPEVRQRPPVPTAPPCTHRPGLRAELSDSPNTCLQTLVVPFPPPLAPQHLSGCCLPLQRARTDELAAINDLDQERDQLVRTPAPQPLEPNPEPLKP